MFTQLAADVFTVAGLLTPDECDDLILRGEMLGFERAPVRTAAGPLMRPGIRDNDRAAFTDAALALSLWERCRTFVPAELAGGSAVGLDENFRYYRYDVGQRFKRHRDGMVQRSATERSRLTCLFYLNDGFAGGRTAFYPTNAVDVQPFLVVPRGCCAVITPRMVARGPGVACGPQVHSPLRRVRSLVRRGPGGTPFRGSATTPPGS